MADEQQELAELRELQELEELERLEELEALERSQQPKSLPLPTESFDAKNAGFFETIGQRASGAFDSLSSVADKLVNPTSDNNLIQDAVDLYDNFDVKKVATPENAAGAGGAILGGAFGGPAGAIVGGTAGSLVGQQIGEWFGTSPETSLGNKLGNTAFDLATGTFVDRTGAVLKAGGKRIGGVPNRKQIEKLANNPDAIGMLTGLDRASDRSRAALQGFEEGLETVQRSDPSFLTSIDGPTTEKIAQKASEVATTAIEQKKALMTKFEELDGNQALTVEGFQQSPTYAKSMEKAKLRAESGDPRIAAEGRAEIASLEQMVQDYATIKDVEYHTPESRSKRIADFKKKQKKILENASEDNISPLQDFQVWEMDTPPTTKMMTLSRLEDDLRSVNNRLAELKAYDDKGMLQITPSQIAENGALKARRNALMSGIETLLDTQPELKTRYLQSNALYGAGVDVEKAMNLASELRGQKVSSVFDSNTLGSMREGNPTLGQTLSRAGERIVGGIKGWFTNADPAASTALKASQKLNAQRMQQLQNVELFKQGRLKQTPRNLQGQVTTKVGEGLELTGMSMAAIPTNVRSELVVAEAPKWAEQIAQQASVPMSGESPAMAIARGKVLGQDFMRVMQFGHDRERRTMVSRMQKEGFMPPNPIQGEVDGFIELPEDRQKFIDNLKADKAAGKISNADYIKQLNAMSDPNNGRIITSDPAQSVEAQQTRQALGQFPQDFAVDE
jgi:hypothetical protein